MSVDNFAQSFAPSVGEEPKVLILGSMPGRESLRQNQYYAHPRNRFWSIVAMALNVSCPISYDAKIAMLHNHGIALWDVLQTAERKSSADSDIKNDTPNDIIGFLREHPGIRTIGFNGQKAYDKFREYFDPDDLDVRIVRLRSTSPANCAFSDAQMVGNWSQLF